MTLINAGEDQPRKQMTFSGLQDFMDNFPNAKELFMKTYNKSYIPTKIPTHDRMKEVRKEIWVIDELLEKAEGTYFSTLEEENRRISVCQIENVAETFLRVNKQRLDEHSIREVERIITEDKL